MQTVYDILAASGRRRLCFSALARGVSADIAAAWMADHSPISLGDARVALSVTLPGERVNCGVIRVLVRKATPVEAVALLNAEIAADQAFDRDRALTHYRGLLGCLEDQQAAERPVDVLERLDHNIEDLMTDEELGIEEDECLA